MADNTVTYEEANPFPDEDLNDSPPTFDTESIPDKPWAPIFEHYGATIEDNRAFWEFEKNEDNVRQTPANAEIGETVIEIVIEKVNDDQFDFTIEVFDDGITILGSERDPISAMFKVLEMSTRHRFEHHFKTDVPDEIVQEIFENEVLTRNFSIEESDE